MTELKDLQELNPWRDVDFHVATTPADGWCCEQDKDALFEESKYKGKTRKRKDRFSLTHCPVPWFGRWIFENSEELPRLVILSLSPGSDYDTNKDESHQPKDVIGTDKEYNELINKNLRGEAGMSEHLFSRIVSSRGSASNQKTN